MALSSLSWAGFFGNNWRQLRSLWSFLIWVPCPEGLHFFKGATDTLQCHYSTSKGQLYSQKTLWKPRSTFCLFIPGCINKLTICSVFQGTGETPRLLDCFDLLRNRSKSLRHAPTARRTACFRQAHTATGVLRNIPCALGDLRWQISH